MSIALAHGSAVVPPFPKKHYALTSLSRQAAERVTVESLQAQIVRMRQQIVAQQQEVEILQRRLETATDKQLLLMQRLIELDDPIYVRVQRAKIEGVIEKMDRQRLTRTADMLRAMLRG